METQRHLRLGTAALRRMSGAATLFLIALRVGLNGAPEETKGAIFQSVITFKQIC
jgi:hypothetical protein